MKWLFVLCGAWDEDSLKDQVHALVFQAGCYCFGALQLGLMAADVSEMSIVAAHAVQSVRMPSV